VVYVDDFKLSGPTGNLQEGWALIRRSIKTDEPHPMGLFLGCKHTVFERTLPDTGVQVRGVEYDMEDFLRSCVERYKELTGVTSLRKAATPFLPEPTRPDFSDESGPIVELSPDEALAALQDHVAGYGKNEEVYDPAVPEQLAPYAAKILMKVLYAARYARMGLLRAVCALAQQVTKWDRQCDMKLYRLMCYIHSSYHVRMTGWIGDPSSALTMHVLADADFAGCSKTSRSTSGAHLSVLGPNSQLADSWSEQEARVCFT